MRSLCVLVVACAVAAGAAGAGHGEVRAGALRVAPSRGAPPSLCAAVLPPALHAVVARNGRPRVARASHGSLPPVALAAGWSIDPLRRVTIAPALPAGDRRAGRLIRTGSARGPPVG